MPRFPEQPLPRIAAIPEDQASAFAILRRPQVEGDPLPEDLRRGFEGGMMGRLGLNPALARRAETEAGEVWVVPGNGFLCLECGGGGCSSVEHAAAEGMVTWTSTRSRDKTLVHGLVPDGVREVTLTATSGATKAVAVHDNVYGALLDGPFLQSVAFTGPAGRVELGPWS